LVLPSIIFLSPRCSESSDVKENGFPLALQENVECVGDCAIALRTCRDQRLSARGRLDDVEDRIFCVRLRLVADIHARCEPDVDPAGNDPEADVSRHGLSTPPPGDGTGLDGPNAVEAGLEI